MKAIPTDTVLRNLLLVDVACPRGTRTYRSHIIILREVVEVIKLFTQSLSLCK